MRLIRRLIKTVIALVLIIVIAFVIVNGYVQKTYGISLVRTLKELKVLTDEVNTEQILYNPYDQSDVVDLQQVVNASAEGLITSDEDGEYKVNFDNLPAEMKCVIDLTDRQVAAMSQTVIDQELNGVASVGGSFLGVKIRQVAFEKGESGTLVNTVFSLDLGQILTKIPASFPFSIIKNRIPEVFYVSSVTETVKGEEAFSYTVQHKGLTINNLNAEDTEDLFRTLDILLGIGSAQSLNVTLGEMMMDALVGNDESRGLAHQLESIGATDYDFTEKDGQIYFSVIR